MPNKHPVLRKSRGVRRRRREPGELATLQTSVRNFCLECMAYDRAEVARCSAPRCWLYPYRFGDTQYLEQQAEHIVLGERAALRPAGRSQARDTRADGGETLNPLCEGAEG